MKYRTMLFKQQDKEQERQEKLATHLHKLFTGMLKPSDAQILERLKVESHE